ncbi:MAG: YigZ family protein [Chloroflexaceae bacterium]|jgi:uncharacterized YigZ family protein|nr:YigZ family protein [Chloroflexaceae bacterium]
MNSYPIPAGPARTELLVANSRFIGSAAHTPTVEAAKAYIAAVRAEFPTASHHCYAYLVGYGASQIAGMSDDGEPSGTAGRPMLAVLRGSDLGDVTVVATRYFGGTLLGTGGLVRAYGDTTKAVLALLPHTLRIATSALTVQASYADYAAVRRVLETHQATFDDEQFAEDVTMQVTLPDDQLAACRQAIADVSNGRARVRG